MELPIAQRVQTIKISSTIQIAEKARYLISQENRPIIDLSVGQPYIDTPLNIQATAIQAINDGYTRYSPVNGFQALREAICDQYAKKKELTYQTNEVTVTCGAKQAIMNALLAYVNPGDEVLIPAPYWVSYPEMVKIAGGIPKIIPCCQDNRFVLTPDLLSKHISKKTAVLILNSPSNPCGMCYNASELSGLAEVLKKHPRILVISDDIYEAIHWQKSPFSNIVMVDPEFQSRSIIVSGVSKSHAMTGWRIGYALGPEHLIKGMTKLQGQMTSGACSISQMAAIEAIASEVPQDLVNQYYEHHQLIYTALSNIEGVKVTPSDGTFYIFPNFEGVMKRLKLKDDIEMANHLLEKFNIATVPGSAFGAENYLRISFALRKERLLEAIERLKSL